MERTNAELAKMYSLTEKDYRREGRPRIHERRGGCRGKKIRDGLKAEGR
jgi:hypothetical protein